MAEAPGSEPTAWELDRRFGRLEQSIEAGFRRMDERLDRMVTVDVFTLSQRGNEQRIAGIESDVAADRERCAKNREALEQRIQSVEEVRRSDRRATVQAAVAAVVAFLTAAASIISNAMNAGATP